MTDFAKLTGQPAVIDESLESFLCKPSGFKDGSDGQLELTMHPYNGTRFKKAVRKMQIKSTRADKADAEADSDMTEDELDAEILKGDGRTAELLARCCDSWNLKDNGKPVVFSLESCTALFAALEHLRTSVDLEITAVGKKTKATKTA